MVESMIAHHRRELAGVLEGLSDEQWVAPSLCEGWTVAHVVAHVTMPFRYSTLRFLAAMVRARGNFQRLSDSIAARDATLPRAVLTACLRDNADNRWKPPGGALEGALTHDVVHGLDITRPLGIERSIDPATLRAVLDNLMTARSLKHFGVDVDGLALEASDIGWSHGEGVAMAATGEDLVLLLTGRRTGVRDPRAGSNTDLRAGR